MIGLRRGRWYREPPRHFGQHRRQVGIAEADPLQLHRVDSLVVPATREHAYHLVERSREIRKCLIATNLLLQINRQALGEKSVAVGQENVDELVQRSRSPDDDFRRRDVDLAWLVQCHVQESSRYPEPVGNRDFQVGQCRRQAPFNLVEPLRQIRHVQTECRREGIFLRIR